MHRQSEFGGARPAVHGLDEPAALADEPAMPHPARHLASAPRHSFDAGVPDTAFSPRHRWFIRAASLFVGLQVLWWSVYAMTKAALG
jgi:hypothetical protein